MLFKNNLLDYTRIFKIFKFCHAILDEKRPFYYMDFCFAYTCILQKANILKNEQKQSQNPPKTNQNQNKHTMIFLQEVLVTLSEILPNSNHAIDVHLDFFFFALLYVFNIVMNSIHCVGITCWPIRSPHLNGSELIKVTYV